jgi:putative ABC transport system substrate-binding protein
MTALLVAAFILLLHSPSQAQAPKKIAHIGFVGQAKGTNFTDPNVIAFRQRLRDLGWVEGENIVIDWRFAEGIEERVPEFITDLVDRKVDVLVATGGNPVRIAKKATQTIPIVMTEHANPVLDGIVVSLARPGGNITGMTSIRRELNVWSCSKTLFRSFRTRESFGRRREQTSLSTLPTLSRRPSCSA